MVIGPNWDISALGATPRLTSPHFFFSVSCFIWTCEMSRLVLVEHVSPPAFDLARQMTSERGFCEVLIASVASSETSSLSKVCERGL